MNWLKYHLGMPHNYLLEIFTLMKIINKKSFLTKRAEISEALTFSLIVTYQLLYIELGNSSHNCYYSELSCYLLFFTFVLFPSHFYFVQLINVYRNNTVVMWLFELLWILVEVICISEPPIFSISLNEGKTT